MKLGVVADDFTGASDIALTLVEGGMATVQHIGVPEAAAGTEDAAVVALKSRSIPAAEAVAQSLAACDWLVAHGAEQIVFKVCSTFDSTDAGNIGPVAEALAERLGETEVLVCPAFPENGRTVYQGHLFVGDRLLSESGMQNHPLTPMTDPDLRRVLARQTRWPVTHLPLGDLRSEAGEAPADRRMVVVDAIENGDLARIAKRAKGRRLVVGGSGIALGLPANFGHAPGGVDWTGIAGPAVVLSGSCSVATRGQVARYRQTALSREITAEAALSGIDPVEIAGWALAQAHPPLIYSSAEPEVVAATQARHGRERVAAAVETAFATLAAELARRGARRIVVAGGETSGAVVAGLGARALRVGPRIAAGVPAMALPDGSLALALKSGNFGGPDFFAEALDVLEGRR